MTTDGTIVSRKARHAHERLKWYEELEKQIIDPDVLDDIKQMKARQNKLLDAIEPGRAAVVSTELAQVENQLRDIQPIGDADVWDYLLRKEHQGGAEGAAAHRLLDLSQRDGLANSEYKELRGLAMLLGVPHCFNNIQAPKDVEIVGNAAVWQEIQGGLREWRSGR